MAEDDKSGTKARHDPAKVGSHTTDQLRGEIDAGHGRDKVAASDPAASPLGTDDEAAGRPSSPEEIAKARANEVRRD